MKKKFGFLIVMLFVALFLTVCVGAKVVNVSDNKSTVTAPTIEFGDRISIGDTLNGSRYYKFSIESNGILTVNATKKCEQGEEHGSLGNIYCYVIDDLENTLGKIILYHGKAYHNIVYDVELSPGIYYLRFYHSGNTVSCARIQAELSFECSHLDVEENIVREATCSKEGYIEEICVECKEVADEYETDKLDHTPDAEWTIIKETSCKEAGERVKYCTVCKEEAESEEIKKLPHEWGDWTIIKETSCAKDGEKARTCKACGDVDKETIDSLEHTWSKWEVLSEASCEQEGLRTHTCSVCSKEEREAIEKEDHRFESWKTTKDASESSTGKKERTCKDCDYTEEETIPKLVCGNEYEWVTTTKATCTSNGTKTKVCDYCGKTLSTQTIYSEGHEWGSWKVTKIPTETSNGLQKRECEICGKTEEKTVTLTHGDYGEWKVTKEATCKESGKKEFVCYCCNKTTKTQTISKIEHSYGEWVDEKTAAPDKDGLQTSTCKYCDDKKSKVVEYDFEGLKKEKRKAHSFLDVKPNSWYNDVVGNCYHYGLMVGNSATTFNPGGEITRAEVITSAVRIYCLNNPEAAKPVTNTSPWYKGYVDYAIEMGIIKFDDLSDYTVPATRAEMAYIFANAVGEKNLEKINDVTSIPDVKTEDKYAKEIFSLYNAGVLTGSDDKGTFNPDKNIVRSESAAIIARISRISDRVKK